MNIKDRKLIHCLEKIFWAYLFVNPLLDIINGFYINLVNDVDVLDVEFIATLGVTPSLVIRLIFLVVFALYILLIRDWKSIIAAIAIGLAWVFSLVSEYLSIGKIEFFIDAQYMARYCYNIVILMVYAHIFCKLWRRDSAAFTRSLNTVVIYTASLLSLAILLPAIFGLGYSTYADILGYRGNRGFFYAGNDITAILSVLLPILLAISMCRSAETEVKSARKWFPSIAAALTSNALLIIGSKTAFLALLFSYIFMLAAGVFFTVRKKSQNVLRGFFVTVLATVVICLILNIISVVQHLQVIREQFGGITWEGIYSCSIFSTVVDSVQATEKLLNKNQAASLLSGRQVKLKEQLALFRNGGAITWLFGLGRGSQQQVIEMDLFEILCYYGVFGMVCMLFLYVRIGIHFLKNFFKNFSVTSFAVFLAIGMTVGYLIIAGHVLFSVTSGFYLAFAFLYSRVLFAKSADDILVWHSKAS